MDSSNFIWDFGKLPFPEHLGKYFIKIGKTRMMFIKHYAPNRCRVDVNREVKFL